MCHGQKCCEFAEFLSDPEWIEHPVRFLSTNRMKSSFHKGTDYFFRNIPAVTQEIGHHRGNWQFPCNVLHNVDFGNGFIVQNKSIIQDKAVAGKHDSNGLMQILGKDEQYCVRNVNITGCTIYHPVRIKFAKVKFFN